MSSKAQRPAPLDPTDPRLKAFTPGLLNPETKAAIDANRAFYAAQRAAKERRLADRRAGPFDRREGERRQFATMADKLAAEAAKQAARKYAEQPAQPSAWSDSL